MSPTNGTTGVVVVTHGAAGEAMVAAAERVIGHLDCIATVAVASGDPANDVQRRLESAARAVGAAGVVFLVDLVGSTPANLAAHFGGRCAVVSGMNLPMLFKLATVDRRRGARPLADELAETGRKSIQVRES